MVVDGESTGECWLFDVAVSLLLPPPPLPTLIKLIVFDDELPIVEPLDVKCCWTGVEFELPEHGFPSLTNTGTATRRGELDDCWENHKSFVDYSTTSSRFRASRSLPGCVDSARPWPSPSPVVCTCSGGFETKFSPERSRSKGTRESRVGAIDVSVSKADGFRQSISCPSMVCWWKHHYSAFCHRNQQRRQPQVTTIIK